MEFKTHVPDVGQKRRAALYTACGRRVERGGQRSCGDVEPGFLVTAQPTCLVCRKALRAAEKGIAVMLSPSDLALLDEALESHLYWQVSDEKYRNNGTVYDKENPENRKISDDPEEQRAGEQLLALAKRLAKIAARGS